MLSLDVVAVHVCMMLLGIIGPRLPRTLQRSEATSEALILKLIMQS